MIYTCTSALHFFVPEQRRSEFRLPPNLGTALEYGHFDHLDDNLTPEQYRQRLHLLLHIEEFERRRQMTRFSRCFLFFSNNFLASIVTERIGYLYE